MICCKDMETAMDHDLMVKTQVHRITDGRLLNEISSEYFFKAAYADGRYNYLALNYCPFCGKPISLGLWAAEKKK